MPAGRFRDSLFAKPSDEIVSRRFCSRWFDCYKVTGLPAAKWPPGILRARWSPIEACRRADNQRWNTMSIRDVSALYYRCMPLIEGNLHPQSSLPSSSFEVPVLTHLIIIKSWYKRLVQIAISELSKKITDFVSSCCKRLIRLVFYAYAEKIYIQLILEFIDNLDLNLIYSVIIKIYYFLNHFYIIITRT